MSILLVKSIIVKFVSKPELENFLMKNLRKVITAGSMFKIRQIEVRICFEHYKHKYIFFQLQFIHRQQYYEQEITILIIHRNDLGSKTCYQFPAYLGAVHFQTIYFTQSDLLEPETKFCRMSWLSNYDTHRQNTIYMPFFLTFYTISNWSSVSGKFLIYIFLTPINKLLLIKKFSKKCCMQKRLSNCIF